MSNRAKRLLHGGLIASVIALSGCADTADYLDPYKKPFAWHPTGAPAANLAAQLVDPRDMAFGRGVQEGDARESALAADRIWQDRPRRLNTTSGSGGTGAAAPAGGGTGGTN